MSNRRKLVIALGASTLAAPLSVFAQQLSGKFHRIGFLGPSSAGGIASRLAAFRAGMQDLGYVEGKNLFIEFRWAEGNFDRLPELAAELVRLNVDLIMTHGARATGVAKQVTATIPIVTIVAEPIELGFVASLARPGGNITGSTHFQAELNAKRLELLKDAVPRARRVAVLIHAEDSSLTMGGTMLKAMEQAAKSLRLELQLFKVRKPDEFEHAFAEMTARRVDAVVIPEHPVMIANAKAIGSIASKQRFPSIGFEDIVNAGGLIGYGPNFPEMFRRAAYFVDKILRGAKPGDIPVEQPTKFEFIVNLKTAKSLGIKFPQSILVSADKVIE